MKVVLGSIMLFGLTWAGSSAKNIQCWEGTDKGFNSTGDTTKNVAAAQVCSVQTTDGVEGAVRAGGASGDARCVEVATKTCTGDGWSTCVTGVVKTCYCKTNLCNNAPATTAALVAIIAMALFAKIMI